MAKFFRHRRVRQISTLLLLAGALACMFPPDSYSLKWWSGHAEHITVTYLLLGMILLLSNNIRLMFVCLGCSAAISFFLLESSNRKIKDSKPTDMPFIRVAHFNVANSEGEVYDFLETLLSRNADILSIQELTPDWDSILHKTLAKQYPYSISLPDLSNGIALYSRFQPSKTDTFYFNNIPNIAMACQPEGFQNQVWVIGSYIRAPLNGRAFEEMKGHLERISFYANKLTDPVVSIGEFNTVPWSLEMQDFRSATDLCDARRGIKPSQLDGNFPLFKVPIDHILFSKDKFDCPSFETVGNKHSTELGIECVLQVKKHEPTVQNELQKRTQ